MKVWVKKVTCLTKSAFDRILYRHFYWWSVLRKSRWRLFQRYNQSTSRTQKLILQGSRGAIILIYLVFHSTRWPKNLCSALIVCIAAQYRSCFLLHRQFIKVTLSRWHNIIMMSRVICYLSCQASKHARNLLRRLGFVHQPCDSTFLLCVYKVRSVHCCLQGTNGQACTVPIKCR